MPRFESPCHNMITNIVPHARLIKCLNETLGTKTPETERMRHGKRPWCIAIALRQDDILTRLVFIVTQCDFCTSVLVCPKEFLEWRHRQCVQVLHLIICPNKSFRFLHSSQTEAEEVWAKILRFIYEDGIIQGLQSIAVNGVEYLATDAFESVRSTELPSRCVKVLRLHAGLHSHLRVHSRVSKPT